jgi:F-type H+-transporting ATPase subunit c
LNLFQGIWTFSEIKIKKNHLLREQGVLTTKETVMKKLLSIASVSLLSSAAFAQEAAAADHNKGLIALAAALAIGIAALAGAFAQAKTAASALDGIARNPAAQGKIFTPMIIGLALIESLVIYAFVIAFFLQGKF